MDGRGGGGGGGRMGKDGRWKEGMSKMQTNQHRKKAPQSSLWMRDNEVWGTTNKVLKIKLIKNNNLKNQNNPTSCRCLKKKPMCLTTLFNTLCPPHPHTPPFLPIPLCKISVTNKHTSVANHHIIISYKNDIADHLSHSRSQHQKTKKEL